MDQNEFQEDITIDHLQLDLEILKQPTLFFKWAERSVEARAEEDRAKKRMGAMEAHLQAQCRVKPSDFGISKSTEAAITAAVRCSDKYQAAQEEWIHAREVHAMLNHAVQAMEIKKRSLESLITLHGLQYFAGPSVPRDLGAVWMAQQDETTRKLNQRQISKTRKRKKKGSKKRKQV